MKRNSIVAIILIVVTLLCSCDSAAVQTDPSSTAFTGVSFTGKWTVSGVTFPGGKPLTDSEMQQIGAGITLELLDGGTYFVYGSDGSVLGQGQYSIAGNILTCTAGSEQTLYQIVDADTLRSESEDKSVTVMTRMPEPSPTATEGNPEDVTDTDSGDDAPDDTDAPPDDTSDTSPDVSNSQASN